MGNRVAWQKWTTLCAVAVSLSMFITACGPASNTSSAGDKTVKLRIAWWGSQSRHDATLKALQLYTKEHPNVTFVPEYTDFNGYWQKLATESAASNAPDLIQMDASYLQEYASRDQLIDLSSGVDTSGMDKSLLDSGKFKNNLYAIALGNNAYGMIYNKVVLEKLGIPLPKLGWTWDDYFNLAKEIQTKLPKGKYAIRDFTADEGMYETYQLGYGKGNTATQDGKLHIDQATWTQWEQTFDNLRKAGVVPPPDVNVSDKQYDPKQDIFLNGTVLFRPIFAAEFPSYASVNPGEYAMITLPRGTQSSDYLKPSMYWSVSSKSKNQEEAKKFIDWFINDKQVADILGTSRGIPVTKSIVDAMSPKFSDIDKVELDIISQTAMDANTFNAGPKGWGNFVNVDYKKATEPLEFGKATIDQTFGQITSVYSNNVN